MPYEHKTDDAVVGLGRMTLCILIITAVLIIYLFYGCAGARKTAQEPLHAEQGGGITIWKIPIIGFGSWGVGGMPNIVVYQYNYAKPQTAPPGTPPSITAPAPVDYQTIYGSSWNDPSLVIFKNESYRRVRVQIDNQNITLEPYGATADLHLDRGEHNVRITIEKPTAAHGVWEEIQFLTVYIRPDGRSQIFHIYDY